MPNVTSFPFSASSIASLTASENAPWSAIRWSAASTSMMVSSPCTFAMCKAAAATAAEVFRPNGSRMNDVASRLLLISLNSSSVLKKSSRLVTVRISLTPESAAPRKKAFCNRLWPSASRMNGLGCNSRETGQRREPAPPHKITGTRFMKFPYELSARVKLIPLCAPPMR